MTDLVATDLTVTILKLKIGEDGYKHNRCQIEFGDSALTYPASGIPVTIASFGCPNEIQSMVFDDQATSGYKFSYDRSAKKIIVHQAPAQSHTHNSVYIGGITATEPVAIDSGDILGKNAATNRTIVGADSATKGGTVSATLAAAALAEATALAIAAQVLECEVVGW